MFTIVIWLIGESLLYPSEYYFGILAISKLREIQLVSKFTRVIQENYGVGSCFLLVYFHSKLSERIIFLRDIDCAARPDIAYLGR